MLITYQLIQLLVLWSCFFATLAAWTCTPTHTPHVPSLLSYSLETHSMALLVCQLIHGYLARITSLFCFFKGGREGGMEYLLGNFLPSIIFMFLLFFSFCVKVWLFLCFGERVTCLTGNLLPSIIFMFLILFFFFLLFCPFVSKAWLFLCFVCIFSLAASLEHNYSRECCEMSYWE